MKKKIYPNLVRAAETITQAELCVAPELSTLVALDATLLATITLIEFQYPRPGQPESEFRDIADGVEEHIIDSIFILARALRSNLSAYYAAIQEDCDFSKTHRDISF